MMITNGLARHQYIRLEIDLGDLTDLNRLSEDGWKVVAAFDEEGPGTIVTPEPHRAHYVLLEKPLT